MSGPLLSICIATMNRAGYLRETLEGLARQSAPELEVVVLDGGSTDATPDVIREFESRLRLRYHRQSGPGGVDRDFDTAVSMASGEYCWLMSDDDGLREGAIVHVLERLRPRTFSLVVVNASICSEDLARELTPRFVNLEADRQYDVGEDERLFIDTGNYLTFIGGVIVRRSLWADRLREPYYGTLFIHVGVLFQAPLPAPALLVADPLIAIRYGNAQWSAGAFEIWMFKWPGLVWSFGFSNAAKAAVCRQFPWARPGVLILHRGKGSYTLGHYRTSLAARLGGWRKATALVIALTPTIVANIAASTMLRLFYPDSGVARSDLRATRSRYMTALRRRAPLLRQPTAFR